MSEPLLVLTGATASGKSALALAVAEQLGAEILSMDSMAVYQRMDIGTAKPGAAERARVPHWLLDLVPPCESFDTARWCELAAERVAAVRARGKRPLFVGGTPLYLMAFFKGIVPDVAALPALRAQLTAQEQAQPGSLHAQLLGQDPAAAARIHRNDTKRLVRALEVFAVTGRPLSAQQDHWVQAGFRVPCRIFALDVPREVLHARIKERTQRMLAAGLLDETRAIRDSCGFSREAAAAIGYAECLRHLATPFKDEEELRNRIRRSTHRLVRKQITWLRRLRAIRWLPADTTAAALLALARDPAARPGES